MIRREDGFYFVSENIAAKESTSDEVVKSDQLDVEI